MSDWTNQTFAGRYHLDRPIGRGGQGEVWAGTDLLQDSPVAVKLIRQGGSAVANAAEATALRLLRVPGVVRLREAGEHQGQPYLAMDLVEGAPFPGPGPRPWPGVLRLLFRLLSTLDEVHALGVLHGDLKPEHAVVRDDGAVVLLDFGLAAGLRVGTRDDVAGTLGYAALELLRGEPASPRTDLFAVGVMAVEALTGALPWPVQGRSRGEVASAIAAGPPRGLFDRCPELPPAAARLILDLLSALPADRPVSAGEAADRLQLALAGHAPRRPTLPAVRPLTPEALAPLFHGPERILHLPSDAASALFSRAGDDPDALCAELERWELLGLARWDGDRLRVGREGLVALAWRDLRRATPRQAAAVPPQLNPAFRDHLAWIGLAGPLATAELLARVLPNLAATLSSAIDALAARGLVRTDAEGRLHDLTGGRSLLAWDLVVISRNHRRLGLALDRGTPGRLRHLLAGDALHEAAREAMVLAARLVDQGHLDEALGLLEQAVSWARASGDGALEAEVLLALTPVALATEALKPAALAQRLLERARDQNVTAAARQVAAAAVAALSGDPEPAEALRALGELSPEDLEIWRMAAVARAASLRSNATLGALVEELERTWVGDKVDRIAANAGWRGVFLYGEERYDASAAEHQRAADLKKRPRARVASLLNAASTLMEAREFARARAVAEAAEALCVPLRMSVLEARAVWIRRAIDYRLIVSISSNMDLVEAGLALDQHAMGAVLIAGEAAIAWRAGEANAPQIAASALDRSRQAGLKPAATLLEALHIRLGIPGDADALVERVAPDCPPLVFLQVLGLTAPTLRHPDRWRDRARRIVVDVPDDARDTRQEVLSPSEALAEICRTPSQSGPPAPVIGETQE